MNRSTLISGQQPQLQQHILQQQLGQFFQPTGVTGFSQPQMQSFNYEEQDNKERQQQQVLLNQDYVAGRVNTNYNVGSEAAAEEPEGNNQDNDDISYIAESSEPVENNIEYDDMNDQAPQATYFNKAVHNNNYATLPNRDAAETLAALAAAGNVNSQLIGKLQKQQQQQKQEATQNDEAIPSNHKLEDYDTNQQINENYDQKSDQDRLRNRQKQRLQEQQYEERQEYDKQQHRQRQTSVYNNTRPLRIMVPDENEYSNGEPQNDNVQENADGEFEYEDDDGDVTNSQTNGSRTSDQSSSEFGSRLSPKAAPWIIILSILYIS